MKPVDRLSENPIVIQSLVSSAVEKEYTCPVRAAK
jgi:hypothetical protein